MHSADFVRDVLSDRIGEWPTVPFLGFGAY